MIQIKVLGSGCKNCETTAKLISKVASDNNITINLQKIEDMAEIMSHGIMSTPGVIVNDKTTHSGGIPNKKAILTWLTSGTNNNDDCCPDNSATSGGCSDEKCC